MKYFLGVVCLFFHAIMLCVPSITIYVHGSQNATKLLSKDIWYCQSGLHHVNELPKASLFWQDAQLLEQGNPLLFNANHYYTFGWSGKVKFSVREKAGKDLYDAVKKLLKTYYCQHGAYPAVRIITHSHGGNIVLNMVKELPFFDKCKIHLELIFLACPVQKVTESFIDHSEISRSYILFSTFDLIQKLDFYKYNNSWYFPKRTFDTQAKNCTQVLVKVNGKKLSHTDFCHSIVRHIPEILQAANAKYSTVDSCMECNIVDPGFLFYNGFNISKSMKAIRKKNKMIIK